MDDIDDYIVDDISLDGETLALLDQEEKKYLTLQKDAFVDAPPVNKKRRTESGWRPGHPNADDFEDLPEISVHGDGTYGVRDVVRNNSASAPRNLLNNANTESSTPRVAVQSDRNNSIGPNNIHEQPSSGTRARNVPVVALQRASYSRGPGQDMQLEVQLQELQRRVFELNEENKAAQLELQKVMDQKLIKEGEASILRKNLEKAMQDHTVQITNLKAGKEEADARQLQIQKEMKDEIERMKTQLLFKQQEIESSYRKVPSTARASRIQRDPLRTPIRTPFEPSQAIGGTPSRLFLGQVQLSEVQQIETPRIRRPVKSPRKINLSGVLPGFQNAFLASPLTRPQANAIGRGSPPGSPMPRSPPSSPTTRLVGNSHNFDIDDPPDVSRGQLQSHAIIDNDFDFVMVEEEEKIQEADAIIQPFNWTSELSRIIITHTLPDSAQPTLQLLLATATSLPETEAGQFAAACSDIFEIMAGSSTILDYTITTRRLSGPLVSMLFIVGCSEKHHTIQSLIHLLMSLVLSMPAFGTCLTVQVNPSTQFSLQAAIREIVIRHLDAAKTTDPPNGLLNETLGLLEALCLRSEESAIAELAPLVADPQVWAALLRTGHKESTLTRTCRLLILLGSYPPLARVLVNVSAVPLKDGDRAAQSERFALLDRLCTFLHEADRSSNEFNATREHILTFFATLSLSHQDTQAALTNNDILIPSLIYFLSNLTNILWEDDERLMVAPQNIASHINTSNQIVTLIHNLVFSTEPALNLRVLLHHNPRQMLTGLKHMFIICFGRLSCADPPEWIDKTCRSELESLVDMARELLDLVVDGPESDSIWSLYQENPDQNESEMDEGEIEARLMGD